MSRVLFFLVVTTILLGPGQVAYCLPPDKVRGSQIPSLRESPEQRSKVASHASALVSYSPRTGFDLLNLPAANRAAALPNRYQALSQDPAQAEADRQQQRQIWESEEMREARSYIAEFCRRSARTSQDEGERFLTELSNLSPEEMQAWLEQYQARRRSASHEQAVEDVARQVQLEQAMEQQQATRRVYGNVKQLQRDFAATNPGGFPTTNVRVWHMRATYSVCDSCATCRAQMLTGSSGLTAAAHVNQMNNPYYAMAAAAAASTPGDMLRSDPRNYMRGDVSDFSDTASPLNGLPVGPDFTFSLPATVSSAAPEAANDDPSGR